MWFHYLMDLHYSQTIIFSTSLLICFTTLWIYTILKPVAAFVTAYARFTTLWIYTILKRGNLVDFAEYVSLPYGFTLFSNVEKFSRFEGLVSLPYGFTLFSNVERLYHLVDPGFTTLWIYTILKLCRCTARRYDSFTTLWIYTILKLDGEPYGVSDCFTTLWIYTILKRSSALKAPLNVSLPYGFTLFSNKESLPTKQ